LVTSVKDIRATRATCSPASTQVKHSAHRSLVLDTVARDLGTTHQNGADAPEFWWLKNGVTVVCSKASVIGKTYSLNDVQVVNGLQTSYVNFTVLHAAPEDHPARCMPSVARSDA
jgi:hypothetical protein